MTGSAAKAEPIIQTVGDLCKVCYTCVRDCPAKAIRIVGGQAQVIPERCITCGNCVRVCRQKAKRYINSVPETLELLNSDAKEKVAIVAPSFPAEFHDMKAPQFVAMLRKSGFTKVCQVAYGADLVAKEYQRLVSQDKSHSMVATSCPAIVTYIEKYQPEMIKFLAPICSPMVASARIAKTRFGKEAKIVFIGPCVAKKNEALRYPDEIDSVLTFEELRKLFAAMALAPEQFAGAADTFDPPHPGLGMLFPISRGLLQAANINEDLISQNVVATDGKNNFVPAIEEFSAGELQPRLLELLCCKGCINGPGASDEISQYKKRKLVSNYAAENLERKSDTDKEQAISLYPQYHPNDVRSQKPSDGDIKEILAKMGKTRSEDELDCGACGYFSCRDHATAILNGLAESEMCLPYVIERLKKSLGDLSFSNNQLEKAKQALINAEKLASMGQLSAGIAHEINNPLGVILLNASLILEGVSKDSENYEDMKLIVEQAEQCKKIVTELLSFARKNKVLFQQVNVPEFISERCLKAIICPGKIQLIFENNGKDPVAEIDPDQMVQVMTNLIVNATEAMPKGGKISVVYKDTPGEIRIGVKDEGVGIAKDHLNKIFEPFFTTKQMGKGTGLGLAVTYGIVKMHRGRIEVSSNCDPEKGPTGTQFTIIIPRKAKQY
ncbi:MAG TPA: [Fe-Fe] hydrogenase large subunit C-terminal domain-containing protein [Victivallales bacterium]|nr:[Fe-Fe] hydrogenase large subunit C-terminal domain-containing protein [Victivallales bacterium]